ncbi:DUF3037 domain-containing protein [Persicitalea jodogahamensis]|uniref:DUF3037 domain-containing protein n=1 Tax=Persicitalea jodogahamensis TaxID=402147 RepID=A0A8J3D0G2_9BACT|nr:DUF3037 domain-containing protein [Persicitalea jodogahamensis]GHB57490.1 hypothetical protein GCM10007390_08640 [Persicitalea jodogahamensis]
MDLFEYATIRVVPRVERGEFMNVGVVLFCKNQKFLAAKIAVDEQRLSALFPGIEKSEVGQHLQSFENICAGDASKSPIAALDFASRFRWLTARRSTIIQASEVHPGLCQNAGETLTKLFEQLVLY